MTDKRAAFQATYSDWKLIRTRKVVQLVFEVPLEYADRAYWTLDGMPDPSREVWCAIARLNPSGFATEEPTAETDTSNAKTSASPGSQSPESRGTSPLEHLRKYVIPPEKRLVQQAAMCCADPRFHAFLRTVDFGGYWAIETAEVAADFVRGWCSVKSRSEILLDTPAAKKWDYLYSRFVAWREAA